MEALRPSLSEVMQRISRVSTIVGAVMLVIAVVGLLTGSFALVALGGLLVLVGLVLVAPALVKPIAKLFGALLALVFAREGTGELAQGNLTRQPSRSAITASATMIGLAIVVGVGGLLFSLVGLAEGMFSRALGSDYLLIPPSVAVWKGDVGASETLKGKLSSIPGVGAVNSLRYAQSSSSIRLAESRHGRHDDLGPGHRSGRCTPKVSGMDFVSGNAQDAYGALAANERNVIVNGILATPLGLKVGDTIPLATPSGQQNYRIAAIGSDILSMKINTAYISQANMKLDFNKSEDILYQVDLAPGADAATAEQWLNQIVANYPQFRLVGGRAYSAEFMEQYRIDHLGVLCSAGRVGVPLVDRDPQHAGDRRHRAHARNRHAARDWRHAPPGVAHDRRRSVVAVSAGHGVWHPGRPVSQLRVRAGVDRGRLHEDGLHIPARRCSRGHRGRA